MGELGNTNCPNRQIIPNIPDSVSTNQQVLYALAKGTGGFEIFNTNDFLTGLEKVAKEMNEYYNHRVYAAQPDARRQLTTKSKSRWTAPGVICALPQRLL